MPLQPYTPTQYGPTEQYPQPSGRPRTQQQQQPAPPPPQPGESRRRQQQAQPPAVQRQPVRTAVEAVNQITRTAREFVQRGVPARVAGRMAADLVTPVVLAQQSGIKLERLVQGVERAKRLVGVFRGGRDDREALEGAQERLQEGPRGPRSPRETPPPPPPPPQGEPRPVTPVPPALYNNEGMQNARNEILTLLPPVTREVSRGASYVEARRLLGQVDRIVDVRPGLTSADRNWQKAQLKTALYDEIKRRGWPEEAQQVVLVDRDRNLRLLGFEPYPERVGAQALGAERFAPTMPQRWGYYGGGQVVPASAAVQPPRGATAPWFYYGAGQVIPTQPLPERAGASLPPPPGTYPEIRAIPAEEFVGAGRAQPAQPAGPVESLPPGANWVLGWMDFPSRLYESGLSTKPPWYDALYRPYAPSPPTTVPPTPAAMAARTEPGAVVLSPPAPQPVVTPPVMAERVEPGAVGAGETAPVPESFYNQDAMDAARLRAAEAVQLIPFDASRPADDWVNALNMQLETWARQEAADNPRWTAAQYKTALYDYLKNSMPAAAMRVLVSRDADLRALGYEPYAAGSVVLRGINIPPPPPPGTVPLPWGREGLPIAPTNVTSVAPAESVPVAEPIPLPVGNRPAPPMQIPIQSFLGYGSREVGMTPAPVPPRPVPTDFFNEDNMTQAGLEMSEVLGTAGIIPHDAQSVQDALRVLEAYARGDNELLARMETALYDQLKGIAGYEGLAQMVLNSRDYHMRQAGYEPYVSAAPAQLLGPPTPGQAEAVREAATRAWAESEAQRQLEEYSRAAVPEIVAKGNAPVSAYGYGAGQAQGGAVLPPPPPPRGGASLPPPPGTYPEIRAIPAEEVVGAKPTQPSQQGGAATQPPPGERPEALPVPPAPPPGQAGAAPQQPGASLSPVPKVFTRNKGMTTARNQVADWLADVSIPQEEGAPAIVAGHRLVDEVEIAVNEKTELSESDAHWEKAQLLYALAEQGIGRGWPKSALEPVVRELGDHLRALGYDPTSIGLYQGLKDMGVASALGEVAGGGEGGRTATATEGRGDQALYGVDEDAIPDMARLGLHNAGVPRDFSKPITPDDIVWTELIYPTAKSPIFSSQEEGKQWAEAFKAEHGVYPWEAGPSDNPRYNLNEHLAALEWSLAFLRRTGRAPEPQEWELRAFARSAGLWPYEGDMWGSEPIGGFRYAWFLRDYIMHPWKYEGHVTGAPHGRHPSGMLWDEYYRTMYGAPTWLLSINQRGI